MKRLAFFFTLFIIAIIVLADLGIIEPYLRGLNKVGGDKVGHFVLYGLLNFFLLRAFLSRLRENHNRVALTVSLILAFFVGLEEWSQSLFPTRTMSLTDLLASYAGITIFGVAAWKSNNKINK
jgi:polysaccharide biosynthesis protein VpsQ